MSSPVLIGCLVPDEQMLRLRAIKNHVKSNRERSHVTACRGGDQGFPIRPMATALQGSDRWFRHSASNDDESIYPARVNSATSGAGDVSTLHIA